MNWLEKCRSDAMKLSKERRQEFLDAMWKGGTLKENYDKLGLTFDEANGIMSINIEERSYHILNKETK
jgi:hypothetical protein